jgi:hypothetical protein
MLPALHELEQAMGVSDQIAGLLAWWIGKPIADARDKRLKALQAAEQHSTVGGAASDQRVEEAKAALNDAASGLRSISRGQWQVRLYCWFVRYDLEAEIAPELTGHGLPLSKCEAYNRVYDQFQRSR